jgi:hypothetical protein
MASLKLFVCDRCDAALKGDANAELPLRWGWVGLKLLCAKCMQDHDAFLRGAKIEYVQVNHEGTSADDRKGE